MGPTKFYWDLITNARKRPCRKPIESSEEMKVKLKERYFPEFYMNRPVDELHKHHKSWSSNDVSESRIVEDINVSSEIASIV